MSTSDCTDPHRRVWGKRNRVSGSEEGDEGQIAGKWFTIEPTFTNTPSSTNRTLPLTKSIPEPENGLGLISLLSSSFYQNQRMSSTSFLNSNIYLQDRKCK